MLNAAARVVSGTHKFDDRGLSRLLHIELHWLDVPEWVVYKLGIMVFNCLHGQAPQYLVELCQPVAGVASRHHLRSATRQLLVVLRHQLSSYGRRAFCVAGPSVWNSLPDSLRNPIIGENSFRQSLKTFLFATYWCIQRIRGFTTMRYINRLFTYLHTYLLTYNSRLFTWRHLVGVWRADCRIIIIFFITHSDNRSMLTIRQQIASYKSTLHSRQAMKTALVNRLPASQMTAP